MTARPRFPLIVLVALLAPLVAAACSGDSPSVSGTTDSLVRFTVINDLEPPVTVAVDDTVRLILQSGGSGGVAVSPTAQWLTWTSAKPTDTTGTPIPDDIGQIKVRALALRGSVFEITNVIDDTTYVTAQIFNQTSARVSIGVHQPFGDACASVLWAATSSGAGYTRIGYYRLLAGTEVRAYRDASRCTGPYVSWSFAQLARFTPKSGLVTLTLSTAP